MDKIDGMLFIFFVSSYRFEAVTKKINNITIFVNMNYGAPATILRLPPGLAFTQPNLPCLMQEIIGRLLAPETRNAARGANR
jgi:hypothetical protein